MQKHPKRQSNHFLRSAGVLLLLVIVTAMLIPGMYARFLTRANGGDSAKVASFSITSQLLDASDVLTEKIDLSMKPGDTETYTIKIKNDSEVSVSCTLTVANQTGNLPLELSLNGGTPDHATVSITADSHSPGDAVHTYTLTVHWPTTDNQYTYQGKLDRLTVTVSCVQID